MIIDYLRLRNYRQYQDEKIIFARPKRERNFTIIQGANGTGKTNILNAITWCLYGKELHMGAKYRGLPLINMRTSNQLGVGEKAPVEVEIQFLDNDGKRIIVSRSLWFQKLDNGSVKAIPDPNSNAPDGSKVEMLRELGKDMVVVRDPIFVINKLIPENIENYFFFDGEQLNDYFKVRSGEKIKEAVFKISQIDLLEKVIDHLSSKKREFLKYLSNLSPKVSEIQQKIEIYTQSLDKHIDRIKDLKRQKKEAEEREREYAEKILSGPKDVVNLEKECRNLERDIKNLEDEIRALEEEKRDLLLEFAVPILTYTAISKALGLIGERREAGDIPPDYKRDFIEKLLNRGRCICGMDISQDNIYRRNVEEFLKRGSMLDEIGVELIETFTELKNIIENLKGFDEKIKSLDSRIYSLEEMRKSKSEKLNANRELIGKTDVEQIKMWQEKREEYRRIIDELTREISRKEIQAEHARNHIQQYRRDLDAELRKEKRYKEYKVKLDFIEACLSAATSVKESIMNDLRKEIEERTKKQFFELIWKKEDYKDVKIDSEYNISVLHQSGLDGIGTLSAGERQVLALSFMAALNSVSGFDVPIFIDTPLGRISKDTKIKIANNLPNYLKDKQVILLVIDEEYTAEVRQKLSHRIGKEYRIVFKETPEGNFSKVIPYEN